MKRLFFIFTLLAVAYCASSAPPEPTLSTAAQEQMLMEAMMWMQYGRYAEAEEKLRRLVELQPDVPLLKDLLREAEEKRKAKEAEPAALLKRRVESTVLPSVNFRQAAPQDVITFLQEETARLSPDKKPINFVWLVPPDAPVRPVTLVLKDVPLADVLRYVTQLAGLQYRLDPHAVVIFQPPPPSAAPAPAPPSSNPDARPE